MGSCLYKVIFFQKYTVFLPKKSRIIFLKVIHPVQCTLMVVVWWFEMCWTMLPTAALCCRRPTKDAHLSRIEAASSSSSSSGNYGDDDFWEWWWYNDHDVVTCVHAHVYQSTSSSSTSFLSCALLPPSISRGESPVFSRPFALWCFPHFHFLNCFLSAASTFLILLFFLHWESSIPVVFAFISLWFSLTLFALWSLSLFLFLDFLPSVVSS